MSGSFSTVVLSSDLAAQTLPLVQATWPAVDLARWREYVQFFSAQAGPNACGMHGLRDSSGCYCGIFAYQLDRDLVTGPMLAIHFFTAVDVINSPPTIRALLDAAESQALELGCTAVRIRLRSGQAELAGRLRALGLAVDFTQFYKNFNHTSSHN
jgi:hypothetical protein